MTNTPDQPSLPGLTPAEAVDLILKLVKLDTHQPQHPDMATWLRGTAPAQARKARNNVKLGTHLPFRGSDVEAYIKSWRDAYKRDSTTWRWLNIMLKDYRGRADHGHGLTDTMEGLQ